MYKRYNILFVLPFIVITTFLFPMAKNYPLPENNNVITQPQQNSQSIVLQQDYTKVVETAKIKHGINLRVLPVKNEYQIGLIDTKKGLIVPAKRYVPAAEMLPQDALQRVLYAINELLKGPNDEEVKKDYVTLIPEGTKIEKCELIVDDFGIRVKLEFSEDILKDIDEIKNILIQEQIKYTLISLDIPKIYGADVFVKGKPLGYYANK